LQIIQLKQQASMLDREQTEMNLLDSKRMALALFLLPGVGVLAQTSTGPLGVVGVAGPTLASDLVNAATGALSQAQVINEAQVAGGAFSASDRTVRLRGRSLHKWVRG
jgi:hypothetical protein